MPTLDDYFDAYDRAHAATTTETDWSRLRSGVRKSLMRPILDLLGVVALMVAGIAVGLGGHGNGYLIAMGSALALLPSRIRSLRGSVDDVRALTTAEELRTHLRTEAARDQASTFVSCLKNAAFGVLFLLVGTTAAFLGKDFRPGLIAGLVMLGLAAFDFLVRLKRTARELDALEDLSSAADVVTDES